MVCIECENAKTLKAHAVTKKYKESGLSNVTLHGVEEYKCGNCGAVYYRYGDVEKLHQIIAEVLIQKALLLTGEEVRFLRKHLGYSSTLFAKLLGYEQETISRIENRKVKVQPSFDHLVRAMVAAKLTSRKYDLHDIILNEKGESFSRLELFKKGQSWEVRLAS